MCVRLVCVFNVKQNYVCVCGQSILKVSYFSDSELGSSAPTVLISNSALHAPELGGNGAQSDEGVQ